jgi:predicted nucleotidyltransferase
MGGGGGGGNYSLSPGEIARLRDDARARLDRSRLDSDLNTLLQHSLVDLNDRDNEAAASRLEQIEKSLSGTTKDVDRVVFGGSVAKHTFVDGLSDIDALVVLDPGAVGGNTPEEMRDAFKKLLMQRLNMGDVEEIRSGNIAVTVRYQDGMEIQLLPAVDRGEGLAIASATGKDWATINPKDFADRLTRLNQAKGNAVIPAIKLAKAIIAEAFPEQTRPTGYHIEALALATFRDYEGSRTPKAMVQRFFEGASSAVVKPIADLTGQSAQVDDYLGEAESPQRFAMARRFRQIARKMEQAESINDWRQLLGE